MSAFLIYAIVGTFTPGPNNILSSSLSSNIGIKKTIPFMFGVLFGTFIVFVITATFNSIIFNQVDIIKKYIGVFGAAYMIYLAVKIFWDSDLENALEIKKTNLFLKAILITFINPKAIIFGITVSAIYLSQINNDFTVILYISIFLAVLCFLSVLVWGSFGAFFQKFLSQHRKAFNIVMGGLLIYSAIIVLIDAF